VTTNGVDYSGNYDGTEEDGDDTTNNSFDFYLPPRIQNISPKFGSIQNTNNDLAVLFLHGSNFSPPSSSSSDKLVCKFSVPGDDNNNNNDNDNNNFVQTIATYVRDTLISCPIPSAADVFGTVSTPIEEGFEDEIFTTTTTSARAVLVSISANGGSDYTSESIIYEYR